MYWLIPKQNLLFIWLKKLVDMLNRGINASSLSVPSVLSVFEFLVSCISFEFLAAWEDIHCSLLSYTFTRTALFCSYFVYSMLLILLTVLGHIINSKLKLYIVTDEYISILFYNDQVWSSLSNNWCRWLRTT
jgi:hypothetical protein